MSDFASERTHTSVKQPSNIGDVSRRKQQPQQARQLLSCTKCRERKVKCDRTKPCSACCARGAPKDCHFIAEGGDYTPIQQSYELRKLRTENLRLKEKLRARKIPIEDDDSDPGASPDSQLGERPNSSQKRRGPKQKRFQGSEWQDSLYFGSPGLANVVNEFANFNLNHESTTLAHIMPRGPDMYTPRNTPLFPFPTMFPAKPSECVRELLSCLPSKGELLNYLDSFEKRVNICSFPHVPIEITRSEVERFLSDAKNNAQMCPDMLALLFAAIALGSQHSVWDKSGEQWNADVMDVEMQRGNVYIAASMQALRLASFMHKPSLLGIQALIMIGPYLTNSGRFLDAWTLFGTTIRLAHAIGLHRHPKYLDPAPPTQRECSIRQTLWWWMLHMDEQYSMTLGRPLGISGIGDCLWPHELTTNPAMLRFGEFVNHFTVLARSVLSSDRLTNGKIDDFTDGLRTLLDTMPQTLQFDDSWNHPETEIPEWPLSAMAAVYFCKTHTYIVLLNRQRIDKHTIPTRPLITMPSAASFQAINRVPVSHPSTPTISKGLLRGRPLVISSSKDILSAFIFFYRRVPAALIDWTIGQQAFNSCMILLLDAIEMRQITEGAMKAEVAFAVFKELEINDVHKLAGLAVERISWGLRELRRVVELEADEPRTREPQGAHAHMQGSDQSEAHGAGPVDTVMGNTGLLLLEDPGLQAFVHEDWAPIAWAIPEGHAASTKEEDHHFLGGTRQRDGMKSKLSSEVNDGFRSVDILQGVQRSTTIRSAPTRYATPSEENHQPHGYTAPTSPTSLGDIHFDMRETSMAGLRERLPLQGYYGLNAPSVMHAHSHQSAPAIESTSNSQWEYSGFPTTSSATQGHESLPLTATPGPRHHVHSMQMRHNSCPTLPQATADPALRRPIYSSPSSTAGNPAAVQLLCSTPLRTTIPASIGVGQAPIHEYLETIPQPNISHVGNTNVHPPFAARPAAPLSTMVDNAVMTFSPTSAGQPPMPQNMAQGQHQHVRYPFQEQFTNVTPEAITGFAEHVSLEEWQGRMGAL